MKRVAALLAAMLTAGSCGYHVAGRADLLPDEIRTIAVPAFDNNTERYRLTQMMAAAITREFIQRTRYRVVAKPEEADAILYGGVVNQFTYPTIFDSQTGRATGMQVIIVLDLRLVREGTGEMLYRNSGLTVQNRYEISADQEAYFEESDTALQRISADTARTVVSAILENF